MRFPEGSVETHATLTISRLQGGGEAEQRPFRIVIEDETSRTTVLELRLTGKQFAEALTGVVSTDIPATMFPKHIGKVHEHKYEIVAWLPGRTKERWSSGRGPRTKKEAEALKPFEVDGWFGIHTDLRNHHRAVTLEDGRRAVRVAFHRYIDPTGGA